MVRVYIEYTSNPNKRNEIMKIQNLYRLHELEYRAELESIQKSLLLLLATKSDPVLRRFFAPAIKTLKRKKALIEQALQKSVLPPLNDSLRHPVNMITPAEKEYVKAVTQRVLNKMREEDHLLEGEVDDD